MESNKKSFFSNLSFYSFLVTILLLPIFFLPTKLLIPLEIAKGFILAIGVSISLLSWLIARMVDGKISIPKNSLLLFTLITPLCFLASALASSAKGVSLFGQGFDIGTVVSILTMSIAMFMASVFFVEKDKFKKLLMGGGIVLGVTLLFQILSFFLGGTKFFSSIFPSTLIGTLNDLSIFLGLTVILSLLSMEYLTLRKGFKIGLIVSLVLSFIFLGLINFSLSWIIIGLISLVIFVYGLTFGQPVGASKERKIPIASFIVVLICLVFLLAGGAIGNFVSNKLGIVNRDVRPSISTTYTVAKNTWSKDALFGSGPNQFTREWLMYKPAQVNNTVFWDTNFTAGFGLIPSFFVTTGFLGGLAWLAFLIIFLIKGVRAMAFRGKDALADYAVVGSFFASLYLWVIAILYTPSLSIFSLAFISTGIFIGALVYRKNSRTHDMSFLKDPRGSFFAMLILIALIVGVIFSGFIFSKKFSSIVFFARSVKATNLNDIDRAEINMLKAINTNETDLYYRSLSEIYIMKLKALLNQTGISPDAIKPDLQTSLSNAEKSAETAVNIDKGNYLNWLSYGMIYEAVLPIGVEGSYENAKSKYGEALKLNPKNPGLYLRLAQLEIANKNTDAAKSYIGQALQMKNNYTDAWMLLSQVDSALGDNSKAAQDISNAAVFEPNNADLFFQLGLLKYNSNDFSGAIPAFERSVILSPTSLNARYLLGMSYEKTGRNDDALAQFKIIGTIAPQNQEIKDLIQKLESGQNITEQQTPAEGQKLPAESGTKAQQ